MKKKFLKIIALTLVILTIIYCPINSFKQGKEVFASVTLTAAALTILKYVIPIVASYVCLNTIGKSYTNSDLQRIITQLNKSQEAIWQLISAYGKLTLYKVINNIKNIGKSIAECASELLITDNKIIENATTYSDSLTSKVQANENLTPNDIVDLGIGRALTYSLAKVATDTKFLNTEVLDSNNSKVLENKYIVNFENTTIRKDLLSNITDTVGYLYVNKAIERGSFQVCEMSYDYYFELAGYRYKISMYTDLATFTFVNNVINITLENWQNALSGQKFPANSMYLNFFIFNVVEGTYKKITEVAVGDILGDVGLGTFKQRLSEKTDYNFGQNLLTKILNRLNAIDTSAMTLWDYLNISTCGEYTVNPTYERPIPTTIPLYPTGSICNDDVWDFVNPTTDRQTMTADTNITVNTDGTISANTSNQKLDGVPLEDVSDIPISDLDNPTNDDTGTNPDTGTGSSNIWEWLKSIWEVLKNILKFEWLRELINLIISSIADVIEAIRNLPDSIKDNIDWGRFKGFFDIFIILIFLLLIICKIFIKLLGVVVSLLTVEASSTFFNQYPTILAGVNYIKGIKVPGINVTLFTVLTYMFTVFFIIYVLKIIQAIYHSFVKQEDNEIRNAEKNIKQNNRINRTNSDIASKFRNGGDNL